MTATSHKSALRTSLSPAAYIVARYILGILAGVGSLLLRDFLSPFFGQRNPYHTAWLAVVFSAWYCGLGPSIVTVVIGAAGIWYWFLPPIHQLNGKAVPEISGLLGFLVFSAVIIALGESTRRSTAKREKAEQDLLRAQEELEQRVRERTAALQKRTAEVVEKATLLDLANDAIFIKTKTAGDAISYWNKGAERLYGWTASEALGQNPAELLRTSYPIPLADIERHEVWEGELLHTTRDGEAHYCRQPLDHVTQRIRGAHRMDGDQYRHHGPQACRERREKSQRPHPQLAGRRAAPHRARIT